jgi:flagellar biosynthesis GTPase FlhF
MLDLLNYVRDATGKAKLILSKRAVPFGIALTLPNLLTRISISKRLELGEESIQVKREAEVSPYRLFFD